MSNGAATFTMKVVPHVESVKLAASLWEIDWVQQELTNLMLNFTGNNYVHPDDNMMILLIKKVIYHSRKMDISLTSESREIFETLIEEMGMQLFIWLKKVWFKLETYDRVNFEKTLRFYMRTYYWTSVGRLDYKRIIESLLEENKFPSEFTKFFELCTFSFEEKLKEWYAKAKKAVVDFIQKLVGERCREFDSNETRVEHEYDYYLLAYWHHRLVHGVDTVSVDDLVAEYGRTFDHSIDENQIGEGNFFSLSAYYGHHFSLVYFWNRMDDNERNIYFIQSLIHIFSMDRNIVWNFYGTTTEVLSFFFKTMNVDRWSKFLESLQRGQVPLTLLVIVLTMPFRDFYFPSLETFKIYIATASDSNSIEHELNTLVGFMKRDGEITRQGELMKKVIQQIFSYADYQMV